MSIVFVEVRKTAQRQNRYTCAHRRGYVSWPLVGTTCETNVLRHVAESKTLRAPSDWPEEHAPPREGK